MSDLDESFRTLDGSPSKEDSPLAQIVGRINDAFDAHDYERTAWLLEQNPIVAWFGMDPSHFGHILSALGRVESAQNPFVRVIGQIILPREVADAESLVAALTQEPDATTSPDFSVPTLVRVGRMFKLRAEGRTMEAWGLVGELEEQVGALQPLFDHDRGWGLMVAVQNGVTAMLAGEFQSALDFFTRARMHVEVPTLAFLTRDACVRAALIESLYGDEDRARALLQEADRVPRTTSWVEETLDASHAIAASVVLTDSAEESLRILETVQLRDIGELWPFYVVALHRALLAAGDLEEGRRRLETFDRLPLPCTEGEGFNGSALPMAHGLNLALRGRIPQAREKLAAADDSIVVKQVLTAALELVAGRPREALALTAGLYEATRGLRLLSIWRLAVIAGAHHSLGDEQQCLETLEFVLSLPGGVRAREARYFLDEVNRFAEERFETWPRRSELARFGGSLFSVGHEPLTMREVEVIRDLAAGLTREQIVRKQFVSMNTLKYHLRSVYRKLGVNSRTAAVLEAERRGWV